MIEDDETTNFINEAVIKQMDAAEQVVVATNGEEALAYLKTTKVIPELIFLDLRMPVMDGFGFLKGYNKFISKQHTTVVVVMLTTSLLETDKEKAKELGVEDYISKPLTKEDMQELLEKHFK